MIRRKEKMNKEGKQGGREEGKNETNYGHQKRQRVVSCDPGIQ